MYVSTIMYVEIYKIVYRSNIPDLISSITLMTVNTDERGNADAKSVTYLKHAHKCYIE
jgi:hypothetical protein